MRPSILAICYVSLLCCSTANASGLPVQFVIDNATSEAVNVNYSITEAKLSVTGDTTTKVAGGTVSVGAGKSYTSSNLAYTEHMQITILSVTGPKNQSICSKQLYNVADAKPIPTNGNGVPASVQQQQVNFDISQNPSLNTYSCGFNLF
tara:strand:- start:83194 stop:83640 length:447 start_codon:yes stop_codon:yes gene_type:complete